MVDIEDLKSSVLSTCGFESRPGHNKIMNPEFSLGDLFYRPGRGSKRILGTQDAAERRACRVWRGREFEIYEYAVQNRYLKLVTESFVNLYLKNILLVGESVVIRDHKVLL